MFTLAELNVSERPYEKLQISGSTYLTNAELLAIILQSGKKGQSSLDLAANLLANEMVGHNLRQLANLEVNDLLEIKGIGLAKAARILACVELAKRIWQSKPINTRLILDTPEAIYKFILPRLQHGKEMIFALDLDCHLQLLHISTIAIGRLDEANFDAREVLRLALRYNAKSVILVHNHPSGEVLASEADCLTTERLAKLLANCAVSLQDHVIVTEHSYLSLYEERRELFEA